jgi:hypothetical protein
MRFEGIWIQRGQRLLRWHESIHGEDKSLGDEFAADYERLYKLGHRVLLVPGKNYGKDELFLFETATDARHFYDGDLSDFECFIGDEHEACGFQEVSLFDSGLRVATKACPPWPQIEVCHQPGETSGHRTGRKILQKDASEECGCGSDSPPPDAGSVSQAKDEGCNLLGPHRHHDESWESYISRRINDAPDADYQARHRRLEEWVKRHSLPEGVTQEQYNQMHCADRMSADLPTGLLTVNGYLWRDPFGPRPGYPHCYYAYLDSKGRKFQVDEWEADDRTTEPLLVETPYVLHCPRVGQRPDLNADHCGYFLTDEVNRLGVMTRSDQMVSLTPTPNLDSWVGKRVRVACSMESIREAYYDGDSCYDRVYLVPKEVVVVDLWGYSTEDRKRQEAR